MGALAVAIAVLVALAGVAGSTREAATSWLADVVPGELLLTSIRPVAADEPAAAEIAALPGVARVSPMARFSVAVDGTRADAAAVVGADLLADGGLTLVAGAPAPAFAALDAGGAAIVPRSVAERSGLVGRIQARHPVRDRPPRAGGRRDRRAHDPRRGRRRRSSSGGRTRPGAWASSAPTPSRSASSRARRPSARPGVEEAARGLALEPASLDQAAGAIGASIDRRALLFAALAAVALLVAALGIVNTLAMNVLERVRELAVLRATGLTRRQAWRLVVLEAAILGLVGALLGRPGGPRHGGGPHPARRAAAGCPTRRPGRPPAAALGGGIVLAVVAALYPARLASRVEIVGALGRD